MILSQNISKLHEEFDSLVKTLQDLLDLWKDAPGNAYREEE